jgi:glyoxylase-like metal-dependent hydrolase (beta-lactamase superfamily II)
MTDRLYFRQWLSGRDYAESDDVAREMRNFAYAIGDAVTGEAVLVDPAHAPGELLGFLAADGMRLVGIIPTHYHADHIGGAFYGSHVEGIVEVLAGGPVPVHVQAAEAPLIERAVGVGVPPVVVHASGDVVMVGDIAITLLHTPGHTPGSQCLILEDRLLTGDTLFLRGCGFTGRPECDGHELYRSLHERLATLPDSLEVFAGHKYSLERSATLGEVRAANEAFEALGADEWVRRFGP